MELISLETKWNIQKGWIIKSNIVDSNFGTDEKL